LNPIHASCVAFLTGGEWRGALITGASGAGKSDLCLRLLAAGGRLVSDDRTLVWASGGALWARAPDPIADLIEARGVGLMAAPALGLARIALVAALDGPPPERLPEAAFEILQGIAAPRIRLEPFQASAAVKLVLALRGDFAALGDGS
jgi:serine kinase of HPr protein (carbohydrate metabolism regulator)